MGYIPISEEKASTYIIDIIPKEFQNIYALVTSIHSSQEIDMHQKYPLNRLLDHSKVEKQSYYLLF